MEGDFFKVIVGTIIGFGIGSVYVQGSQTLEINRLNGQIQQLEQTISKASASRNQSEEKVKRLNAKVEEFYQQWKGDKP